jgi:predicted negative regulator of RcsB-dependent stress response
MSSTHLSRKELKKEDLLAAEVKHGVEVVAAHKNQAYVYGGIVVLAIAGYLGYNWYSSSQSAAREQALWDARKIFVAPVGAPTVPGGLSYQTEDEKNKAANAAWTQLADKYPSSAEGAIAKFRLASEKLDQGKTDEAASMFREVADKAPKEFSSMAKESLAQILWQQGKTDEAKKILEGLISSPTSFVSSEQATLTLASLQAEKNPEEARKLLDKLDSSRPAVSMRKVEIQGQLPPAQAEATKK